MSEFPKFRQADYPKLYLEQTDKDLAKSLHPSLRYAYFKTIAKGGKSLIQSCKDLHLGRVVCHKSLLPEFANDPIEQKGCCVRHVSLQCCSTLILCLLMKSAAIIMGTAISP
ncbi:hypothetical protein ACMAY9_06345 [Porticoccaceae bacterium nBUS_09]